MNTCIVIPCPSNPPYGWDTFEALPSNVLVVIVDDSTDINGNNSKLTGVPSGYQVLDHSKLDLPVKMVMPRKSAASRNLGHWWAYHHNFDTIIALDYDCRPSATFVQDHLECLGEQANVPAIYSTWINPIAQPDVFARGYPYEERIVSHTVSETILGSAVVKANLGLWTDNIDVNGLDRLTKPMPEHPGNYAYTTTAAIGNMPVCGMNIAFSRDLVPAYFFLPDLHMGQYTMSRHDDIWAGYILMKLMRRKRDVLTFGKPVVEHLKLSNLQRTIEYEHWMHILSKQFYDCVNEAVASAPLADYAEMFAHTALYLEARWPEMLFNPLTKAMRRWSRLFLNE